MAKSVAVPTFSFVEEGQVHSPAEAKFKAHTARAQTAENQSVWDVPVVLTGAWREKAGRARGWDGDVSTETVTWSGSGQEWWSASSIVWPPKCHWQRRRHEQHVRSGCAANLCDWSSWKPAWSSDGRRLWRIQRHYSISVTFQTQQKPVSFLMFTLVNSLLLCYFDVQCQ